MIVSVIAAVAANGIIGREGGLPWRLPEDLRRFKRLTLGHPVIMGRRTFESMGKPLAGRRNLVVTSRPEFRAEGAEVVPDLDAALAACAGETEVFIIGGAALYAEALPRADRFYLTRVEAEVVGDVRFPEWDPAPWRLREDDARPADARHPYPYRFQRYDRD